MTTIKLSLGNKEILKQFRECPDTGSVNLKTEKGFVYLTGGILSKLEDGNQSVAIERKWVGV